MHMTSPAETVETKSMSQHTPAEDLAAIAALMPEHTRCQCHAL
jgi:hypothetical protein